MFTGYELLEHYEINDSENEFNVLITFQYPLGGKNDGILSSVLFSGGTEDLEFEFYTPPIIKMKDIPKVSGGDVQIHLRCFNMEAGEPLGECKHAWPFAASWHVNGHSVKLMHSQRYRKGEVFDRDAATNISGLLLNSVSYGSKCLNKVTMRRQMSNSTNTDKFAIFAQEVFVSSLETMIEDVKTKSETFWKGYRSNLQDNGKLSDKSTGFDLITQVLIAFFEKMDGGVPMTLKVSLRCPLALTRINIPVNGNRCDHLQCFDLVTFLKAAKRSARVHCPHCSKAIASPSALVISPLIERALEEHKNCDEVVVIHSGEMMPVDRSIIVVPCDDEGDCN